MSQDSPTTLTAADLAALARDLEAPATPARARAATRRGSILSTTRSSTGIDAKYNFTVSATAARYEQWTKPSLASDGGEYGAGGAPPRGAVSAGTSTRRTTW